MANDNKQTSVKYNVKNIVIKIAEIITFIGVVLGIISITLEWIDNQQQKKPFFVVDIKNNGYTRNISIINDGGAIKNVAAEMHYFIYIISAQKLHAPSQAVYFFRAENIDYNIEEHTFKFNEPCNFKEEIYCELMTYLNEEKVPIAIMPFINSYFIVSYEDLSGKQYTEVYLFEKGDIVTKKSIKDYNHIVDLVNSSKNHDAENIWDFYSANRNDLGLSTKTNRTTRMEESNRPKNLEEYIDNNYQELDDKQKVYFLSLLKQYADVI